jgi:hypothetical protein
MSLPGEARAKYGLIRKINRFQPHRSDLPPLSNHGSSLSEAAEATSRRLPADRGPDCGPPYTEMSLLILDKADQSPTVRLDARGEAPTEPDSRRLENLSAHPKAREGGLQIPEPIVLITRRTHSRRPPTGRFDPKVRFLPKGHMSLGFLQRLELDLDRVATNII